MHGDSALEAGTVRVVSDGDRFRATRDVALSNGYAGAIFADVQLRTIDGDITVGTCRCERFEFVAELAAWGDTEAAARARLEDLDVEATDTRSGQLLAIWVEVAVPGNKWHDVQADLSLMLPAELIASDALLDTTNGNVRVSGLRTENLEVATTNGFIDAGIKPAGHGEVYLYTTNGNVALEVDRDGQDVGIHARGSTVNGVVDLGFEDTQPVGEQSTTEQRVQSPEYESIELKLDASMATVNGSIRGRG